MKTLRAGGEQKEINLLGNTISYVHKMNKRSRTLKLAIYRDGSLVVTTPPRVSEYTIVDFLYKKAVWVIEKIEYFKNSPQIEVITHTKEEIVYYKKIAEEILHKRLPFFNNFYTFSYNTVTIKNVTTRWGSCSSKGNLNFNYKIALLPPNLSDYIIVHELCHLKEMNHSERFWKLVEKQIPNHKELRKQLRTYK